MRASKDRVSVQPLWVITIYIYEKNMNLLLGFIVSPPPPLVVTIFMVLRELKMILEKP